MGFLIDAVAHGLQVCQVLPGVLVAYHALLTDVVVWLRLSSASSTTQALCRSDVDGVDSQA